jgi:hypothetical protein
MRIPARPQRRFGFTLLFCAAIPLLASCRKAEITEYRAPKESAPPAPTMPSLPPGMVMPASALPPVSWQVPSDWKVEPAGQMRAGAFSLKDEAGHAAEVTIIPLPDSGEDDLANVNRWRKQLGLVPATADDLPKVTQAITLDGAAAELFDLAGPAKRIVVVMQKRGGTIWFVKMMGDSELVGEEKQTFQSFIASIKIGDSEGAAEAPAAEAATPTANPAAPKEWQPVAPGPMQQSKFTAAGGVEISVSEFQGSVGGVLANVNRWRGQLGLAPIAESELARTTQPVENVAGALMVDLASSDGTRRMLAAIVPRGTQTAFYKMTGPPAAVETERPRFVVFVQAAK